MSSLAYLRPFHVTGWRRLLPRTLLLALLLAGQWALLAHETDLHAHEEGGACEVCLLAQPLGGPLGSSAPLGAPHRLIFRRPLAPAAVSLPTGPNAAHAPIRAPPAVLS